MRELQEQRQDDEAWIRRGQSPRLSTEAADLRASESALRRRNRQLAAVLALLVTAALIAAAFFLGQYSKAGIIAEHERRRALQRAEITGLESEVESASARAATFETKLGAETKRAQSAESGLSSAEKKNSKLSGNLSHSQKLVGLYRQMSDVDGDLSAAFKRGLKNIWSMLDAANVGDWSSARAYANEADDALAEAKRLEKKRDGILGKVEAASE